MQQINRTNLLRSRVKSFKKSATAIPSDPKGFWAMKLYDELIAPLSKRNKLRKVLLSALTRAVKYNIPYTAGDFCTILPRDYFSKKILVEGRLVA